MRHISNNKDNALVGSYFSNSLISDSSSLNPLDVCLDRQINNIRSEKLKRRLKQMTFQSGWNEKRFYTFSPKELQEIVKAWKK